MPDIKEQHYKYKYIYTINIINCMPDGIQDTRTHGHESHASRNIRTVPDEMSPELPISELLLGSPEV